MIRVCSQRVGCILDVQLCGRARLLWLAGDVVEPYAAGRNSGSEQWTVDGMHHVVVRRLRLANHVDTVRLSYFARVTAAH